MSRTVDEEGCPVYNDALIVEKEMTKEEAIKILELTRDGYLEKANAARSFDRGTFAEMFEDKTIALNMAIYALKASNRPSDERKGEGWSTISVDENVGSNAAISAADAIVKMGEAFDLFAKATADMLRKKE